MDSGGFSPPNNATGTRLMTFVPASNTWDATWTEGGKTVQAKFSIVTGSPGNRIMNLSIGVGLYSASGFPDPIVGLPYNSGAKTVSRFGAPNVGTATIST